MAIYALSDLHGEYGLWNQIKEFIQENDIIVFLGDAIDRGPAGIPLLKELLNNEQVVFICGNHELDLIDYFKDPDNMVNLAFWYQNGGMSTKIDFDLLSKQEQRSIVCKLESAPVYAEYKNAKNQTVILSHAGFSPDSNVLSQQENVKKYTLTTDRKHIDQDWPQGYDNVFMVHGHTPTGCQNAAMTGQVIFYCHEHKINIDIGATFLKSTALLNLDTFEITYFYN